MASVGRMQLMGFCFRGLEPAICHGLLCATSHGFSLGVQEALETFAGALRRMDRAFEATDFKYIRGLAPAQVTA